ncbi:alanine racemase [Wenzhouxiangella marina]|uniref:Metal-activated pyridoxal enzyme n=1 Tax=Wenzhouxiangella marina TaxID=1579979 RepID=A0A0K0XS34_9GAMM|nr:alanine racemase [Wenzhouxiangella marina]AKS40436.1 Metal-activated pyridoxal enzyme [Wenzhouxiangella marina]MBB6088242.1 D-serine deaminase-like pyridoxal phosphate-dependent protein [Wenzhouxiangella marina]
MPQTELSTLPTPALLIDAQRMAGNVDRMNQAMGRLGVPLRPHLKTVKNAALARRMLAGHPGGATVSTLAEADYFFAAGIEDLTYAVGLAPGKLGEVARRQRAGMKLTLLLDAPATARALVEESKRLGERFQVLIELDADGERGGLDPADPALIETAGLLVEGGQHLAGVLVHAGGSYACRDEAALIAMAEHERRTAVDAAQRLRQEGFLIDTVSVGSTPTALFARDLSGVSEVRAGVYALMDRVMASLGVCALDDIAVSVLTEVIGHRPESGELLVDAGWTALSRDLGSTRGRSAGDYGLVCDLEGAPLAPELLVLGTHQEHGRVGRSDGQALDLDAFPIGRRLRILPNHACATAGQFERFWWLDQGQVEAMERCRGW